MAREESDREDLLREATALVERVELMTLADGIHVVIGFRRDGSASFYFGVEPVYQFNVQGELRRAHLNGRLYKAESGKLIALDRHRTADEVQLIRSEVSRSQTNTLLSDLHQRLSELTERIREHRFQKIGQVPTDADILGRALRWLEAREEPRVAASARVG